MIQNPLFGGSLIKALVHQHACSRARPQITGIKTQGEKKASTVAGLKEF